MPVGRLVRDLADKAQVCTQRSWKRPYGVGLLVGGYDKTGAKLYYNCPSGNYFEYKANAVGARSQVCTIQHASVWRNTVWQDAVFYMHQSGETLFGKINISRPCHNSTVAEPESRANYDACCMLSIDWSACLQDMVTCDADCLWVCWQAARTYLERKFEEFEGCSLDQLIRHSLQVGQFQDVPEHSY